MPVKINSTGGGSVTIDAPNTASDSTLTLPTTGGTLAAAGPVTTSGLTMATSRLLGRTTAGTGAVEEISVGSGLTLSGGSLAASGGGFSNMVVLTSGTSWTAPTGVTKIKVIATGGGAAGGGCSTSDGTRRGGGGGGAGTAIRIFTVTPGSSYTYAIGAGGTAGSPGANPGNSGGNTTFTVGATTLTANGGSAGGSFRLGGAGGTASNGDLNLTGAPGISSDSVQLQAVASGQFPSGNGGASFWGGGGLGLLNETGQTSNGNPGTAFGSGGGGAVDNNTTNRAGGAGAAGVIVIEY